MKSTENGKNVKKAQEIRLERGDGGGIGTLKEDVGEMSAWPVPTQPIEPLFNGAFVRIFGQQESAGITRSLINAVLDRAGIEPIGEISSIEAEHTESAGSVECRSGRMDVRVVATGKRLIDLEAQLYPEDINSRSVFYAAHLIVANTPKGAKFKEIPQAIVITLLDDKPLFPDEESFVSVSRMEWRAEGGKPGVLVAPHEGSDRILFVLVELQKVRERYNELSKEVLADPLLAWLYLLTAGFDDAREAEDIMCLYPDLREFAEMYGRAIDDPEVIRAYENEAAAYRNYHSRKDYFERMEREAMERGEKKGMEIGEKKGMEIGERRGEERGERRGERRGEERGEKRGIKKGRISMLAELVRDGVLSCDAAAERLGVAADAFVKMAADEGVPLT